jgi:tetratricopeptide (TPR) repeat protein
VRTAHGYAGRVYALTENWDLAIERLNQVIDSTGQPDLSAQFIVANMYDGPKKDRKRAIALYRRVLDRRPDSGITGQAMLKLGAALCAEKEYDEGRKVLVDLKNKFMRYDQLVVAAQFNYAISFEDQGRWDRALSEFQWLMDNYPYTDEAYRTALHIPDHFSGTEDRMMRELWCGRAEEFFLAAVKNRAGQAPAMAAYAGLADLYRKMGQSEKSLETLDKMYQAAPGTQWGARALYNAAALAKFDLRDTVRAQQYLDRLNREFGVVDSSALRPETMKDLNLESIQ